MFKINGKDIEIHVKGGFSERKGIKHFSDIVQTNDLNERTRNKLYFLFFHLNYSLELYQRNV